MQPLQHMSIEVGAQLAALHRNGRVVGGGVGGPIHGEVGDIAPGVVGGTPHHDHLAGTRVHPLQVLYGAGNCTIQNNTIYFHEKKYYRFTKHIQLIKCGPTISSELLGHPKTKELS